MAIKKKPETKRRNQPMSMPASSAVVQANDNSYGSDVMSRLAGRPVELEYEMRDIPLSEIELNPLNEMFRSLDEEEDIRILAEDIQRNGLMHNLVVYPAGEGRESRYVMLSGERRWKALDYLQKNGDARWNIAKGCRVIVTPLTENEKKVLLYSANLQVRGGFADESIRRKAVTEFIRCLQQPPYNMPEHKAKAALKEISPQNARTLDRDWRIETKAAPELTAMLDEKMLLRSEMENLLRLTLSEQVLVAGKLKALQQVEAEALARDKEKIRKRFVDAAVQVAGASSLTEAEEMLEKAAAAADADIQELLQRAGELRQAEEQGNHRKVQQIREETERQPRTPDSFLSYLPKTTDKIMDFVGKRNAKKRIARLSAEEKQHALEEVNEMLQAAAALKALLEGES